MAKLTIDEVKVSQFKGERERTYKLFPKTDVVGKNASGKTTLGIAMTVPFTSKDLTGRTNPELHPDFMTESEPHITISGKIDDKPINIEMIQKDTRTKKDREAGAPPKIANKYRINDVDMSATNFKKELTERGINMDLYEQLSNPDYFFNLTEAKKRTAVFELASEITDADVIKALGNEVSLVKEQIENYTLTEIQAKAKRSKKDADEQLNVIPERIIALESAIPDMSNVDVLTAKKEQLQKDIEAKTAEIEAVKTPSRNAVINKMDELKQRQRILIDNANAELTRKKRNARANLDEVIHMRDSCGFDISTMEARINRNKNYIADMKARLEKKFADFKSLRDSVFPEDKSICPNCGQPLPAKRIEQIKSNWETSKKSQLEEIETSGKQEAAAIRKAEAELEVKVKDLEAKKKELAAIGAELKEAEIKAVEAKDLTLSDGSDIEECREIEKELDALAKSLNDIDGIEADLRAKKTERENLINEKTEIEKELAKSEVVDHIRKQIADLEDMRKQASQNSADAEAILYQIDLINRKKNELLADSVNAHFPDFVKFKLFDIQKNGEYKDVCVPLVRNDKGEWKEYGKSCNTALEVKAKLAVLGGFQKFNDMYIPIICEGASELDSNTKRSINMDTQLVFLSVVDDSDLTIKDIS